MRVNVLRDRFYMIFDKLTGLNAVIKIILSQYNLA